jgi:hypothetical protein
MRPILEAFNTAVDNELAIQRMHAATYAPPAPPARIQTDEDLEAAAIENDRLAHARSQVALTFHDPAYDGMFTQTPLGERIVAVEQAGEIARQALNNGVSAERVADQIRSGYVQLGNYSADLSHFSPVLLELTVRNATSDILQNTARQARQAPAQQAPEPAGQSLLRTPYNELQQAITPVERALTMNMQARIAQQAANFGIDGSEVADMIRGRARTYGGLTVNLDALSSQALEVLARDTSDTIEAQNRARDRRPRQ